MDGIEEHRRVKSISLIVLHHTNDGWRRPTPRPEGNEIPLGSRIIAAADSYDALTTDRPYRCSNAGPALRTGCPAEKII